MPLVTQTNRLPAVRASQTRTKGNRMISIKQQVHGEWAKLSSEDEFWRNAGILQPFAVETQAEFDYLWSMQLMIGKEYTILLIDRDENLTGLPPSFIKIDIPL